MNNPVKSNKDSDKEITSPQLPDNKIMEVLHELEFMSIQKGSRSNFDISKFDKSQIDKLLETVSDNEKNAFSYHTKRLDTLKEIELKKIDASVINQKTIKILFIGAGLFVFPIVTIVILIFKDNFFISWLTFLAGIVGGFGLGKVVPNIFNQNNSKNLITEDEKNE